MASVNKRKKNITAACKLYPEKWTWILQLPMFVDSETVVWTPKVPRIPIV